MSFLSPETSEFPSYYSPYIEKVSNLDLNSALLNSEQKFIEVASTLSEIQSEYRYKAGKWSIKEVLIHINDAERVFAYRVLRFARNDKTELSGFDENKWVPECNAAVTSLQDIIAEHRHVRQSTISLFKNLPLEVGLRRGVVNGKEISVQALGFIICGHALHHLQIINDRYLNT